MSVYKVTIQASIGVCGADEEEAKQNLDTYIKRALGQGFVYEVTNCEEVKKNGNSNN